MVEGVHGIHQYQFKNTGSIGGVHVPDYNNVYVYTRQTEMCLMYTQAWNDAKAGVPLNEGQVSEGSVSESTVEISECVTYSKEDFSPENREDLLSKMLKSMNKVDGLPKIRKLENEVDASEIYATTISNGKITITGGEKYQYKARAYEKLVNASMNCLWSRMPNVSLVSETDVLNQASGLLKYYMAIDNDVRKNDKTDSIVNHVEEAYTKWQSEFVPQRYHFEGRA